MTLVSTSVMTHVWYCTPLHHDSWIVGHSVVLWSNEKPGGGAWRSESVHKSDEVEELNTEWNQIFIGCFKTAFFTYRLWSEITESHKRTHYPALFLLLVFQFNVQIQCEWLTSWICQRKKERDPSNIRHSCLFNCFNAEDAGWQFCPRVYGSEYWG